MEKKKENQQKAKDLDSLIKINWFKLANGEITIWHRPKKKNIVLLKN